jgi:hypothetical protein
MQSLIVVPTARFQMLYSDSLARVASCWDLIRTCILRSSGPQPPTTTNAPALPKRCGPSRRPDPRSLTSCHQNSRYVYIVRREGPVSKALRGLRRTGNIDHEHLGGKKGRTSEVYILVHAILYLVHARATCLPPAQLLMEPAQSMLKWIGHTPSIVWRGWRGTAGRRSLSVRECLKDGWERCSDVGWCQRDHIGCRCWDRS